MGDLINLKRFKKRAARDASVKQASTNRVRFGRSRSKRELDEKVTMRANDLLSQHRLDGEDAS